MKGATTKVDKIWNDFFKDRVKELPDRFKGWYRAEVVETNDPLRHHRVRIKVPELHNQDLKPEECPWAVPDPAMGGKRTGTWNSLCKGDWVWVNFEKGHPYGPIWSGTANPTRRKFYTLESIYGKTQMAVNDKGEPADTPNDYDEDYLPKDERPMSSGIKDRYGNLLYIGAVGFFPKEHKEKASPVGTDPMTKGDFKASTKSPEENKPDFKLMAQISKYGNYMVISDVGYKWKNEFDGDFDEDEEFEIKRWKYLQKLLSENESKGYDERRIEWRTRFGHKIEMRDVGFKKSRDGEFDDQIDLTDVDGKDEKNQLWIRAATKDGTYMRFWSKGADLEKNNFIKRLNKSDVGTKPFDDEKWGDGQSDARGWYMCTPYQLVFAGDDAGSDAKDPQNKEKPFGNGIFIGGRRDGFHYGCEFNLKDELQRWLMYTSTGMGLELNQKWDYACLTTKPPETIARPYDSPYKRVPWSLKTFKGLNVEKYCFHLMLDYLNKYIRLKTPKEQGIEMRDGDAGCGGTWTEMRDADDRGFWLSKDNNFGIWRDKKKEKYICINDNEDTILIRNGLKTIQIFAQKDIELIANGNIKIKAGGNFDVSAGGSVNIRGGDCKIGPNLKTMDFKCNTMCGRHLEIMKPRHPAGPASACGSSPSPATPSPIICQPLKPEDFDTERGCDPTKGQKGPIDPKVVHCGPGEGKEGDHSPPDMDPKTGKNPSVYPSSGVADVVTKISAGPPTPADPVDDPIAKFSSSGVLWFGTSSVFDSEINQNGIIRSSKSNPLNTDDFISSYIPLATTSDGVDGLAEISVQKYGGDKRVYRLVAVNDGNLLSVDPIGGAMVRYSGDMINGAYIEVFE